MLTVVGHRSTVKRADNKAHARAVTEPRRRPSRAVREHGIIVQELCESRGGRPELSVLTSLVVSVDVKNY